MNAIDQSFNRSPCSTDWRRYDSPTVLRRHGRDFLERTWKSGQFSQEQHALSKLELETLMKSYGGRCLSDPDRILWVFADDRWARRCQLQLIKRGVSTQQLGYHLKLQEQC